MENLVKLIEELRQLPTETAWLEFKHNNFTPELIGADISALANSAAYSERTRAYMIWGIDDETHEIVGTEFDQYSLKIGNEELENWLRKLLSSNAEFEFHSVYMDGKKLIVLIIFRATNQTVTFKKVDYIRVGSYTKKLNDHPQMKAQLWDKIRNAGFEEQYAKQDLTVSDIMEALDFTAYFDLKKVPLPSNIDGMLHYMSEEGVIAKQDNGLFAITNLGAMLFARRLTTFPRLQRKAVRVVQFQGNNKLDMIRENVSDKGYVLGFASLLDYIEALLPAQEVIVGAIRESRPAYPTIALREALANALIHQDFSITGTSVVVEIFENRIEITNPGTPLVDVARIVDNPPKSRNEKLASLMRCLGMCEELGTGWDKIILSCELLQLPAPNITTYEENTKVTLYSKVDFFDMPIEEKIWACYMHACVKFVQGEYLTNSSLRTRFGLEEGSSASISRLIKEACDRRAIKKLEDTAPRYTKYMPFWA